MSNMEFMDDEVNLHLKERIKELEDENYTLREELKGEIDNYNRFTVVHNRLKCFDDDEQYIPVSHIGDNNTRKTVIEFQLGDESLNKEVSNLVCGLLNCGVFDVK